MSDICESCKRVKILSICPCVNETVLSQYSVSPMFGIKLTELFPNGVLIEQDVEGIKIYDPSDIICTKPSEIVGLESEKDGDKLKVTVTMTMPEYEVKK